MADHAAASNGKPLAGIDDLDLDNLYWHGYRLSQRQMHAEAYEIFAVLVLARPRSIRFLKAAGVSLMRQRLYSAALLPLSLALLLDEADAALAVACAECLAYLGGHDCVPSLLRHALTLSRTKLNPVLANRAQALLDHAVAKPGLTWLGP